jgi:hypothetical protein
MDGRWMEIKFPARGEAEKISRHDCATTALVSNTMGPPRGRWKTLPCRPRRSSNGDHPPRGRGKPTIPARARVCEMPGRPPGSRRPTGLCGFDLLAGLGNGAGQLATWKSRPDLPGPSRDGPSAGSTSSPALATGPDNWPLGRAGRICLGPPVTGLCGCDLLARASAPDIRRVVFNAVRAFWAPAGPRPRRGR